MGDVHQLSGLNRANTVRLHGKPVELKKQTKTKPQSHKNPHMSSKMQISEELVYRSAYNIVKGTSLSRGRAK